MNIIVSIGRNVRNRAMSLKRWDLFRVSVSNVVRGHCSFVPFSGNGGGVWGNIGEDSFTIVGVLIDESHVSPIRERLAELAKEYNQESIAMTLGEVDFVGPA